MQKYWTSLKLVCLGCGLVVLVLAQRGPAYVSLRLVAGDRGETVAVEIDGDRIGLDSPRSHLIEERFELALASRGSVENPWIQIQIDDGILWQDARGALKLAFRVEREPTISLVWKFSERQPPEEQIVLHQPGQATPRYRVGIKVKADGPERAVYLMNDLAFKPASPQSSNQLNATIRKLIGEPESDKAQRMRADINIQDDVEFRYVREVFEAVSGERTVVTGKWLPYIRLIRLDEIQWAPQVDDPFQTHGGVI